MLTLELFLQVEYLLRRILHSLVPPPVSGQPGYQYGGIQPPGAEPHGALSFPGLGYYYYSSPALIHGCNSRNIKV